MFPPGKTGKMAEQAKQKTPQTIGPEGCFRCCAFLNNPVLVSAERPPRPMAGGTARTTATERINGEHIQNQSHLEMARNQPFYSCQNIPVMIQRQLGHLHKCDLADDGRNWLIALPFSQSRPTSSNTGAANHWLPFRSPAFCAPDPFASACPGSRRRIGKAFS